MSIFNDLITNPEIIDIYHNVDNVDSSFLIATHGWKHIHQVITMVENILTELNCDLATIENGKIAALLHDIGCIKGKENHATYSYTMAKEFLKDKNLSQENQEIILDAIRNHSNPEKNHTIVGVTLALADKLDFNQNRMCPLGMKVKHYNQMYYIEKVNISIKDSVIITFVVNEKFDRIDLEQYYFTQKIFSAIKIFANYIQKPYEVKINNDIWQDIWN